MIVCDRKVPAESSGMTASQLTVSAIRRQFESVSCLNSLGVSTKHVTMPPKSASETQRKQPPKTRPKPTISVAHGQSRQSAFCSDVRRAPIQHRSASSDQPTSTGDDVFPSPSSHRSAPVVLNRKSTPVALVFNQPSQTDPIGTQQVSTKRRSRDEMDIVRASVKDVVVSRWASTSSLTPDRSFDDVKAAIARAKQKLVLQRIVGTKLEGEGLQQQRSLEEGSDQSEIGVVEISQTTELWPDRSSEDDVKPNDGDDDDDDDEDDDDEARLHAGVSDHESSSSVAETQPTILPDTIEDATIEASSAHSSSCELPPAVETSAKNDEESDSTRTVAECPRIRRPLSLYPQLQQLSPTECASPPPDTDPTRSDQPLDNRQERSAPVRRGPQATSHKSYLMLTEFVGDSFSFLDEFDYTANDETQDESREETSSLPADSSQDLTPDASSSAAAAERCPRQGCCVEEQQCLPPEISRRSKRPKSMLRKSIVLANGEILEIIGDAFLFLDDYDDQSEHC